MLPYKEVLDRWERSRAFGDPRTLEDFSKDLNTLSQSDDFSAPLSAGWWTKASTAADKYFFEPVANVTTAPLGEAVGGLFGGRGAEIGRKVGLSLPRALAQTLPLYLAGPEAGVPATIASLGLTGGLFAGQTYADTQSGKAALLSGVTAAALPGIGRFSGNLAARAFGVGEKITEPIPAVVAREGAEAGFKAARLAGSQAGQIGALQASQYLGDRENYDPLSPEFWANQIPFTVFDIIHAGTHPAPTKKSLQEQFPTPVTKPTKPYEPPPSTTEERTTVESAIAELERVASSPTATTEQKESAFQAAVAVTAGPRTAIEIKRATKDAEGPMVTVTGFGKLYDNGNMKLLVDPERSPGVTPPEHGNVWVNDNPLLHVQRNPDGSFTLTTPAKYVNHNVESPLVRTDLTTFDPNQPDLPVQAKPWEGPLAPDDARTLEKNGVVPLGELSPIAYELEVAAAKEREARTKIATVPQSAEEVAAMVPVEVAKPIIERAVANGATPTQAVEQAKLVTHTPTVDEAQQALAVLREQAKTLSQQRGSLASSILDEQGNRRYFGSSSEAQQFLDLYRQEHPEDQNEYRVTPRKDRGKEEWFIRKDPKTVSIEGSTGHSLENLLSVPVEERPDVSFDDMLGQLDRASNAPRQFGNSAGIDDVPDAILAIRRAKVVLPLLREGKGDLKSVNEALKGKGILSYENETEFRSELRKVREGLQDFSRTYRNFSLDSVKPFDPEIAAQIGLHDRGLGAALDWWIAHPESGLMGELAKVLKNAVPDLDKVKVTSDINEGWVYNHGDQRINIPELPADASETAKWGMMMTHEVAHHASREILSRNDPAAVKFRSTLRQALDVLKASPEIPARVLRAIEEIPKWYNELVKGGPDASENFAKNWDKIVGKGHDDWFHFAYGMANEEELLAQMFGSRRMVEMMSKTKMPKTVGQTVLQWFSQVWNRLFGGGANTDSVLAHVMAGFDNYLSGPRVIEALPKTDLVGEFNRVERVAKEQKAQRQTLHDEQTGATLDYVETPDGPFVLSVDTPEAVRGQGGATRLLNQVKEKGTVWLDASASEGLTQEQLVNWYKKNGFVSVGDGDKMTTKVNADRPTALPYNGRDYVRDSLIYEGVRPEALASRIDTVEKLFATGDLQKSLDGIVREAKGGLLPATSTIGPDFVVAPELVTGTSTEVGKLVTNLLADDVPKYQDVYQRLKEDVKTAVNLYQNIKKGTVPGELPPNSFEKLQQAQFKIDAMERALKKQENAIERWRNLDNFTYEGFEDTQAHQLVERRLPGPPDLTGLEDEAHGLLGLEDIRRATAQAELESRTTHMPGPITRALMLTQYVKKLYPAFRPVADHVRLQIGKAVERITTLNLAYSYDHDPKVFSRTRAKENARVQNTESLSNAASDIYRIAQIREATGKEWSFTDPEIASILNKFNTKDRQAIINEHNSNRSRHHVYTEQVLPQSLTEINNELTAKVIAARETGMLPEQARETSQQLYGALALLSDPKTAPMAAEALRAVSSKMQPATFLAALQHAKSLVDATNSHIEFMRSRPSYVSEQRFDKYHLVMRGPNGEAFRVSRDSKEELLKIQARQEKQGYTKLDFIPKSDANVSAGGVNAEVLDKMQELDVQAWNATEAALKDVDPTIVAKVLPATQRAAQYAASADAFKPTPGVTRRFVGGREYLNMIDNAHEFYVRSNNWLRHRLTDATTSLDMLHPDIAANRALKAYADQHVQNSLTPDNPFFRKLVEATYFQRLGFALGNSVLESVQNLATGMQALIAENGGVGDSFKLWGNAVKNIWKFHVTKKWDNAEHQWVMDKAARYGAQGLTTWNDIIDPDRESTYAALNIANGGIGAVPQTLLYGARKWATVFQRYNDQIGWLAGYDLGRSKGMSQDEAFNFAWDVKERGYFSGGKAQRSVGLWSIKTKPVPQMLSSLQTYTLGWFSQMATDYKVGFGGHSGFTAAERYAAKKAFLYGLAAQAVLAGAIGLPGVGQGLALLKQSTGLDLKGKVRASLAGFFGEDTEYGGILTNLALRGGLAGISPIDPSNRAAVSFPFVGIDPYKGFDLSALLGAPGSTVSDVVQGLLAAARGDAAGVTKLLPSAVKPAVSLVQSEGDVRDKRGALLYKLSPTERFLTAIGLPSSRIQAARDTAEAVKNLNDAAQRSRESLVDELAKLARQGRIQEVQRRLSEYQRDNPRENLASLVRSVGQRVTAQTVPYDYRRDLNPGADIAGLGQRMPSTELLRRQTAQGIESQIGLRVLPNFRAERNAAMLDDLMNSDPFLPRAEAVRRLQTLQAQRRSTVTLPPEYQ